MDEQETIDILLATYNGEKYLEEQLNSILTQNYSNFKLIISDDCSQDKTKEILEKYQSHPQIEIYYQEKNIGYMKNFEFLLQHVEHNLYMLCDQDDIWLSNKIEKTYAKMKEKQADLVFTDLEIIDETGKTISKSFNRKMEKIHKITKTLETNKIAYLYNTVTGCTILAKKQYLNQILPLPENTKYIIHDSWIALMTSISGKIAYLDEPTVLYRQHVENQVGATRKSFNAEKFSDIRKVFIEVKQELFSTYLQYQDKFPNDLQELNQKAKMYFDRIENKKISFRGWYIFHKLYKYELPSYYILNFIILNMPLLGEILFKIRKAFKGKRCGSKNEEEA